MKEAMTFGELLTHQYLHEMDLCDRQARIESVRERMDACSDAEIVRLWELFGDVPVGIFDEQGELLEDAEGSDEDPIDEPFFCWSRGSSRDEVWRWFDHHYSLGLSILLYAKEEDDPKDATSERPGDDDTDRK